MARIFYEMAKELLTEYAHGYFYQRFLYINSSITFVGTKVYSMGRVRIESIGCFLPERVVATSELVGRMAVKPAFDIEQITGIKTRRFRDQGETSYSMAMHAVEDCLKNSIYMPSELDCVINASISRFTRELKYVFEPPLSLMIKNRIGAHRAINFDISNACAGMNTGIYILHNMIKSGIVRNGMVVSGETITTAAEIAVKEIRDPIDPQFASLTGGDAAAAVILDRAAGLDEGIDFIDFVTLADWAELCFAMPSTMNPGVVMYTDTFGMSSMELVGRMPAVLNDTFRKYGRPFNPADFDYVIFHQVAMPAIKKYRKVCEEKLGVAMPPMLWVVDELGNTASNSHYVVIHRKLKEGVIKAGTRLLIVSTASGVQGGIMSCKLGDLKV